MQARVPEEVSAELEPVVLVGGGPRRASLALFRRCVPAGADLQVLRRRHRTRRSPVHRPAEQAEVPRQSETLPRARAPCDAWVRPRALLAQGREVRQCPRGDASLREASPIRRTNRLPAPRPARERRSLRRARGALPLREQAGPAAVRAQVFPARGPRRVEGTSPPPT